MEVKLLLKFSLIAIILLTAVIVAVMARKRILREYPVLAALLLVQAVEAAVTMTMLYFSRALGLNPRFAFEVYFLNHWTAFAFEVILQVLVIYSVFSLAMKPLQGLHQIGKIIFRWVAGVSVMVSLAIAAGPHLATTGFSLYVRIVQQMQQGINVLTLCLLLFVCFSAKPLGLTYGSRIFGVILGLGVTASANLILAAWLSTGAHSVYSGVYLFGALGNCVALAVWGIYFALPEPERKLITLPTTSPFFYWNRISEALGDEPGDVVIGGFRPSMLAAAEFQMLTAPTLKRSQSVAEDLDMIPAPVHMIHSHLPQMLASAGR